MIPNLVLFVAVATNDTVTFTLAAHTGNKITYNWTFGDGDVDSKYDDPTQSHVYKEAGVYFIELIGYNKISSAKANVSAVRF